MVQHQKIGDFTEDHLLKTAAGVVAKKTTYSEVLDTTAEKRFPRFQESELSVGKVLGRGGFCVVKEITKIDLSERSTAGNGNYEDDEDDIQNVTQDRGFMEAHYLRSGKGPRYAIKSVQDASRKDPALFINSVVDLAIEARFLAVVRHPNIIKMRATASVSPFSGNFFVVLDKLYDTLTTRMQKWKRLRVTGVKKMFDRGGKKERAFWVERCMVAFEIARAVQYLHSLNIVYRDIKPDNIGYDVRGDVKIFDFGLAKEIDPHSKLGDGTYHLTSDTGSPRYMAPEVALGGTYNTSVDVYSFCILLWQVLSLEHPFEGFTLSIIEKKVYRGGSRPRCDPKWPQALTEMLRKGWGVSISARPTFDQVAYILQEEVNKYSKDGVDELMDVSLKSEISMRRALKSSGGAAQNTPSSRAAQSSSNRIK